MKNKQKICFVIYSLSKGGAEKNVALLTKALSKYHDVHLVVFENKMTYSYDAKLHVIPAKASNKKIVQIKNLFIRSWYLRRLFKKNNFDKIICFMESAYCPSILTGFPIIASVRVNPEEASFLYRTVTLCFLKFAKNIIVNSQGVKNCLQHKYGFKGVDVIKNPCLACEDNVDASDVGKENDPYLLAVGRLELQKNFQLLISAFSQTSASKRFKLIIVGEGSQRNHLEALIKRKGLEDKIKLPGQKNNVSGYFKSATLSISSSLYEGFSNVLIESLGYGTPVIATDCPYGNKEIVQDHFNGILVENNNQASLSKAIDDVVFNEDLYKKLKNNAKASVSELSL